VDYIGAVIVALFILKVSWDILGPALNELMDRGASNADVAAIAALARSVAGVCAVHKIRTRRVGGGLFVDLHVLVDGARTVRSGHAIAGAVKALLLKDGPEVLDVVIHIEPDESTP
jgi:divalent metal cation (Fe/Co/Zn/Cd) transporter